MRCTYSIEMQMQAGCRAAPERRGIDKGSTVLLYLALTNVTQRILFRRITYLPPIPRYWRHQILQFRHRTRNLDTRCPSSTQIWISGISGVDTHVVMLGQWSRTVRSISATPLACLFYRIAVSKRSGHCKAKVCLNLQRTRRRDSS